MLLVSLSAAIQNEPSSKMLRTKVLVVGSVKSGPILENEIMESVDRSIDVMK